MSLLGSECKGKICIEAKRVFDACIRQISEQDSEITISNVSPSNPATPLNFVSARSSTAKGTVTNLTVDVISTTPRVGRVKCNVEIPVTVNYIDNNGIDGSGSGTLTVPIDIVMSIPEASVMPYEVEAVVSAVCPDGTYSTLQPQVEGEYSFIVQLCASIIMKIVCIVDIVIATNGYASIPPCVSYSQDACAGFFELPLFPSGQGS